MINDDGTERPSGTEHIWQAVGRDAAAEPGDVSVLLSDVYGRNSRGHVNAKAAAADLGVSERTVQRWVKQGKLPSNDNGERVRRGWKESPEARAARMNPRRESRIRSKGTTVQFKGVIRISSDKRNHQSRPVNLELTPEQAGDLLDALLAGNDEAAHAALEDAFGDHFGGDVELAIESLSTHG